MLHIMYRISAVPNSNDGVCMSPYINSIFVAPSNMNNVKILGAIEVLQLLLNYYY